MDLGVRPVGELPVQPGGDRGGEAELVPAAPDLPRQAQRLRGVPQDPLALGGVTDFVLLGQPVGQLDQVAGQDRGPAFERVGGGELVGGHHQRSPGRRQVGEREGPGRVPAGFLHRARDQVADASVGVGAAQDEPGDRLRRVEGLTGRVQELRGRQPDHRLGFGGAEEALSEAITRDGQIFASSWSEPGAGAAKQHIATTATARADGGWKLSGAKTFTTGAGVADLYLILARTGDSGPATGSYGQTNQGIFVVDAAGAGFEVDGVLDLAGMRRSATGLIRLDAYVARSGDMLAHSTDTPAVIGYPHVLGLTLGAVALGVAETAHGLALEAARQRSLVDSPLYRHHLFELGSRLAAVRGMVDAATQPDGDRTGPALTAKVFASETAETICRGAQEIAGSAAFSRTHPLNRLAQDARAVTLMGPPNYLCRELVTADLGAS